MPEASNQLGDGENDNDSDHSTRGKESEELKGRKLLNTQIGKVVGGREAANRFQDLIAKTLRIQK